MRGLIKKQYKDMELDVKKQIVAAAIDYVEANGLSQEQLAETSGVSIAYVNSMLQGKTEHSAGKDKTVEIAEKYFRQLAKAVGYSVEKTYWQTVETAQYLQIKAALAGAKSSGRTAMIIGGTGCGKSYTTDMFCLEFPTNTFRVTVSSLYTLSDIINEICGLLKVPAAGSRVSRINKLASKLRGIKLSGGKPVIILDEAENMTAPVLKMVKGLYDAVKSYCAIVLIGTPQLQDKLIRLKNRDKDGMPQFYRRFKAGIVELAEIKKKEMLHGFLKDKINDKGLIDLLLNLADNYGELNDYLEPALRETDRLGQELDEELFRMIYGMERKTA